MLRFAITVFISAFLLFQVQPIIANFILPWFGGTAAVWTVCMLFFQVMLLVGYAYAHLIRITLPLRVQIQLHILLLLLALVLMPITPGADRIPEPGSDPVIAILLLLLLTIGLPFWLISASGPLFQHWYNRCFPGRSPYRLYALSNIGSLLALLSYPFIVEPQFTLRVQTWAWSASFALFVAAAMACAWKTWTGGRPPPEHSRDNAPAPPRVADTTLWLLLSFCGSVLLLASTNEICVDVAVVPFLWVLPLSLYLLSYILCFDSPRWYKRWLWLPLFLLALGAGLYAYDLGLGSSILFQVGVYSGLLFTGCMVCHGELVRIKPHPEQLTAFYLHIAVGGALGGLFVSVLAPMWYEDYRELPLVWLLIVLVVGHCLLRDIRFSSEKKAWLTKTGAAIAAFVLVTVSIILLQAKGDYILDRQRNFYGVLRVEEYTFGAGHELHYRSLLHGRITHGGQIHGDPVKRRIPTTYYGNGSGVDIAIDTLRTRKERLSVGAVGLGVGTIAAHTERGDTLRFYEINPAVVSMAQDHFTFLADARSDWEVVMGDARISMTREKQQNYDVLAIDAFSSDAIPVHLMTREAFGIYLEQLDGDGILAVHISNRHLDLEPVVYAAALAENLDAITVENEDQDDDKVYSSTWVLLGRNLDIPEGLVEEDITTLNRFSGKTRQWTDNYTNLVGILR